MDRKQLAMDYFREGYNCCQSLVLAFSDLTDMDEKTLLRLASSFGGGLARKREVCGAVSGMAIIAGILYGYDSAETGEIKAQHYGRIQQLAGQFEKEYGSIICRILLKDENVSTSPIPTERTEEFYRTRPCLNIIGNMAEILENYIKENPVNDQRTE